MRVAVIGSGVAGLTAAYVVSRNHDVTLFEKDTRFGGHANTVSVAGARGQVGLDTGFIVHNERTYPNLLRLFGELGVATQDSDMSFGVRCEECGLEYAGARGLAGMAARPANLISPAYLRMLIEVKRFHRQARALLCDASADRLTLGDFLAQGGYSDYFHDHFILPLAGAIWSCAPGQIRSFPARYLIQFFANHGMLTVKHSPTWKTVSGGSQMYVDAVVDRLGEALGETAVVAVERDPEGVTVTDVNGAARRFDRVVIATHPDQALALLADPSPQERRSPVQLSLLEQRDGAAHRRLAATALERRAGVMELSARGLRHDRPDGAVTYHLNRLQALDEPVEYCVTLNQSGRIAPHSEIARMVYEHPVYTIDSLDAQRRLPSLSGVNNTAFCGAYHGWGFHEDGCRLGNARSAGAGV